MTQSDQLAALAFRYRVPAIFQYRAFAAAGGLMSYGGSLSESYRLSGVYTGRILKGETPAILPVQQSTKIELTVNLKTARALGLIVRSEGERVWMGGLLATEARTDRAFAQAELRKGREGRGRRARWCGLLS